MQKLERIMSLSIGNFQSLVKPNTIDNENIESIHPFVCAHIHSSSDPIDHRSYIWPSDKWFLLNNSINT